MAVVSGADTAPGQWGPSDVTWLEGALYRRLLEDLAGTVANRCAPPSVDLDPFRVAELEAMLSPCLSVLAAFELAPTAGGIASSSLATSSPW